MLILCQFSAKDYVNKPNHNSLYLNKKPYLLTGFSAGLTRFELATSGLTGRFSY